MNTSHWRTSAASPSQPPHAARVCQAPLAAGVLHDAGAGVPFVSAPSIAAAAGRLRVVFTAGKEAPCQVLEQVPGKEHVDPGVTATVEAGEQHGDDEGHVWGWRQRVYFSRSFTDINKIHMHILTMKAGSGVYFHRVSHLISII